MVSTFADVSYFNRKSQLLIHFPELSKSQTQSQLTEAEDICP